MDNGRFNLGIIGASNRGLHMGKHFQDSGCCRVTCVCDLFPHLLQEATNYFGREASLYEDVDRFLLHPELDAVMIATNDKTHADIAVKVLAAGKHLYLEKPMAQTIEDCDRIVAAWQGNCTFLVGLELRYCTLMQQVKALVSGGEIGRVILAMVNDNVSVGGNYYYHGRKRKKEYIVSLVLEKGTHSLDLANWIIDDTPVKVYASSGMDVFGGNRADQLCRDCAEGAECPYNRNKGRFLMDFGAVERTRDDRCVYSRECDVSDNALVIVDYKGGARLSYMECHFTPEYSREFTFIGDGGKLTAFYNNEQDFKIMVWRRHQKEPVFYYPEKVQGLGSHGGGDDGIIRDFCQRVLENRKQMVGIKGARDSAAIAIAAFESEESGMPVWIPENSTFMG